VGVLHAKLEGLRYYAPFIDDSCVLRRYGTVEVRSSIEETIFGSERTICETAFDLAAVPVFVCSWGMMRHLYSGALRPTVMRRDGTSSRLYRFTSAISET
jgi:hypothetical protein